MRSFLLVIALASCVQAQEVDSVGLKKIEKISSDPIIIFPMVPVLTEDDIPEEDIIPVPVVPKPKPPRAPKFVSDLSEETWLVIESSEKITVTSSPLGHVSIQPEEGPVKVRGKFADGTGQIETRTFTSKYLYFINAVKKGTIEILVFDPSRVVEEKDIPRYTLHVMGVTPNPPPEPDPGPKPDPEPVTPSKLQVVIIEDPAQRAGLPAEQIAVMDGSEVRGYLKSHCVITNGTPDFRILSVRQDVSGQPAWVTKAFSENRGSIPFIVLSNGKSGFAGPLPKTIAETLTLLRKYGGE